MYLKCRNKKPFGREAPPPPPSLLKFFGAKSQKYVCISSYWGLERLLGNCNANYDMSSITKNQIQYLIQQLTRELSVLLSQPGKFRTELLQIAIMEVVIILLFKQHGNVFMSAPIFNQIWYYCG